MEYIKCVRCNGAGEQTFHRGTVREHRIKCPCCDKGMRKITDKIKKIVEEE